MLLPRIVLPLFFNKKILYDSSIQLPARTMKIHGFGYHKVTTPNYYWDGNHRVMHENQVIFQYTLAGCGEFRLGNTTYPVPVGSGFFCIIPSNHSYYFPKNEKEWEFIYITVNGDDAFRHWESIIESAGPVVSFYANPRPIEIACQLLSDLYNDANYDKYVASTRLYEFIMEVYRLIHQSKTETNGKPDPIIQAIEYMQQEYPKDISIDQIAAMVGLSKYHFTRKFHKKIGQRPMEYLQNVRMEQASLQLKHSDKMVKDIAAEVGFATSNYFIKVFRAYTGLTPNQFRHEYLPEEDE